MEHQWHFDEAEMVYDDCCKVCGLLRWAENTPEKCSGVPEYKGEVP